MKIYQKLDVVINALLFIYNLLYRLISVFSLKKRKILACNKKLVRNKDYCFILGNGPSLNDIDLHLLQNEDTFAVNYFYQHSPDYFKSKFFVAIDQRFYKTDEKKYILKLYKNLSDVKFILKMPAYSLNTEWDENRVFFIDPKLFQYNDFIKCDCTKPMTACINVVLQCIQIALYMGYKRIYLLGCDFSQYAEIKSKHFYDKEDEDKRRAVTNMGDDARWASLAHYHHYALKKYADAHGQVIINLTDNSLIDAYPFSDFDKIIQKENIKNYYN